MTIQLYADMLNGVVIPEQVHDMFAKYYEGERFIHVMPYGAEVESNGFIGANAMAGYDDLQIFVTGNDERILVTSRFDNLGKGASGAAVQCMNIHMGIDETTGLKLFM